MTKAEVFTALQQARELQVFDSSSKLWQKAFELYLSEKEEKLDLNCGKCYEKVKAWLEKA